MPRKRRRRDRDGDRDPDGGGSEYADRDENIDGPQSTLPDFEDFEASEDGDDETPETDEPADAGLEAGVDDNDAEETPALDDSQDDEQEASEVDTSADAPTVEDAMELNPDDEAGADVDLGDTSPEAIEEEFGVDLDETYTVESQNYHLGSEDEDITPTVVMDRDEQQALADALEEKHGDEAEDVLSTLRNRKSNSSPNTTNQRGELIVKRALGVKGEVRNRNGEFKIDGDAVSEAEVAAARDIARVSQAFAKEHYADADGTITAHRGLRSGPSKDVMHRVLERPNETSHKYDSGVTESHAVAEEIAERFDNNVKVSYDADVEDVAYAIDAVTRTTMYEAEVQMVSKDVEIPDERAEVNLGGFGGYSGEDATMADVREGIQDPASKDESFHEDLTEAIAGLSDDGRSVNTDAGRETLVNWAETVESEKNISSPKESVMKESVEKLTGTELD